MSKSRFLGIDCFRGLAAFAVVMIHSGGEIIYSESGTLQPDLGVKILVQACQVSVPFFWQPLSTRNKREYFLCEVQAMPALHTKNILFYLILDPKQPSQSD
jgi:peptidoglycan/LPS O-acetylase OafA/YrhL